MTVNTSVLSLTMYPRVTASISDWAIKIQQILFTGSHTFCHALNSDPALIICTGIPQLLFCLTLFYRQFFIPVTPAPDCRRCLLCAWNAMNTGLYRNAKIHEGGVSSAFIYKYRASIWCQSICVNVVTVIISNKLIGIFWNTFSIGQVSIQMFFKGIFSSIQ